MNEKKDLLNDLKIDRSEDNEPGSSFIKRLGFVLVSIIILFLVPVSYTHLTLPTKRIV